MPSLTPPATPKRGYLEMPLRRLSQAGQMAPTEQEAIRALDGPRREIARGEALIAVEAEGFHFVLEGWGCQQRLVAPGRRQIFELILPGDVVGRLPGDTGHPTYTSIALTQVITTEATSLGALNDRDVPLYPGIMAALAHWRAQAHERLLDHVVRLGSRSAYESVAHLLVELFDRLAQVGLTSGVRMPFAVAQERLGELLGLSEVHVNRTMTRLKEDGHVVVGPGWMSLPRLKDLARLADYPRLAGESA